MPKSGNRFRRRSRGMRAGAGTAIYGLVYILLLAEVHMSTADTPVQIQHRPMAAKAAFAFVHGFGGDTATDLGQVSRIPHGGAAIAIVGHLRPRIPFERPRRRPRHMVGRRRY